MAETADPTAAARKAATTRKTNATKRSTAAKKGAQTRAAKSGAAARNSAASKASATATRARTTAAKEAAETRSAAKSAAQRAAEVAERSVLVPFGAALVARDRVTSALDELRSTYSTRKKAEAELRRFERRGTSALKPIARDARKTRARVENAVQSGKTAATKASTSVQERLSALV